MKNGFDTSQDNAATCSKCGGICYVILAGKFLLILTVKEFKNRSRFDKLRDLKLTGSHFLDHSVQPSLAA